MVVRAAGDAAGFISGNVSRDGRWLIGSHSKSSGGNDVWIKRLGKGGAPNGGGALNALPRSRQSKGTSFEGAGFTLLAANGKSHYNVAAYDGHFYITTDEAAPRQRVFRTRDTKPARAFWEEIIPEHPSATFRGLTIAGGYIVLNLLENLYSRLEIRELDGTWVRDVALPGLGTIGGPFGHPEDDEAYFNFTSFAQPIQAYKLSVKSGASALWRQLDLPVDLSSIQSEQVSVVSKDGTRIPMFLVYRRGMRRSGDNPTLLSGYGGFAVNRTVGFSSFNAVWLEHGGVIAEPVLRGGGEFGEAWHRAGMLENKQNVFDDFVAAAEWLIAEGITQPRRLALSGGSNGGLLVGAAMTQRPELFRAVVCSAPLLDMVRYESFGSGQFWVSEYGSVRDPEQFAVLRKYSPYHRVKEGTAYPALLLLSPASDTHVDPLHARKFLAAIQWANAGDRIAIMRLEQDAGHSGPNLVERSIERSVDTLAFLLDQLGMN